MPNLTCLVASSDEQREDAARLRREVYRDEESMPLSPESPQREKSDSISHLVAYVDGAPVGSVRLVIASPHDGAGPGRFGLELESCFTLSGFEAPGTVLAEVTRFCVLRRFRGSRVAAALFDLLRLESRRRGVTHWVAAANMETDIAEDAQLTYRLIEARGLLEDAWRAQPCDAPSTPTLGFRPAFTPEQRLKASQGELGGLKLPRTLNLFATKMGARYIGPPAYEPRFRVFALPLAVELATLTQRLLRGLPLHSDTGAARAANDPVPRDSKILALPPG
jgi:hypothetical protein